MRIALLVLPVLLAGCAAPRQAMTPEQLRASAPQATDFQICRGMMVGYPAMQQIAQEETRRRGLDCSGYSQAIMAEQRQRQAAAAAQNDALMDMARMLNPPVAPMPPPVTCTTQRLGMNLQTVCR